MEWKVKLNSSPIKMGTEVFIYQEFGDQITYLGKDFKCHTFNRMEAVGIEDVLVLNDDQLKALAIALGEKGFDPKKEYTEGKLEATVDHLKDMRSLLKLK